MAICRHSPGSPASAPSAALALVRLVRAATAASAATVVMLVAAPAGAQQQTVKIAFIEVDRYFAVPTRPDSGKTDRAGCLVMLVTQLDDVPGEDLGGWLLTSRQLRDGACEQVI